jgi:hypothetical protein
MFSWVALDRFAEKELVRDPTFRKLQVTPIQ